MANSKTTKLRVLISASDPGGGNAVVPVARRLRQRGHAVMAVIGGKSREIFRRGKVAFQDAEKFRSQDVHALLKQPFDLFLFGVSGGRNTVEKKVLHFAHKNNIPSIAVMDYWSNFWAHFLEHKRKNKYFLPDFICVADERMKREMIREGFLAKKLFVTGNPHFDTFTKNIKAIGKKNEIFFASQPFIHDRKLGCEDYGYTEYEVLEKLLKVLKKVALPLKLVVRLHPREPKGKYDVLAKKKIYPFKYDHDPSVESSLGQAGLVIGMNSMVLFQAAVAGKRVVSFQPNVKNDILVTNKSGLSTLVTSPVQLEKVLKKYYSSKVRAVIQKKNLVIPHATENVVKVIEALRK